MNNQWLQYGPVSNKFRQTYIKGFLDVSGNAIIRNGNIHLTHGDISMNGAIFNNGTNIITQITDTSNNLFDLQTRVDASLNNLTNNLVTTDCSGGTHDIAMVVVDDRTVLCGEDLTQWIDRRDDTAQIFVHGPLLTACTKVYI